MRKLVELMLVQPAKAIRERRIRFFIDRSIHKILAMNVALAFRTVKIR